MLKLYTYFRSSASYRVRIALNLKGLEHQAEVVWLLTDEHLSDAYRDVNPQMLLPALVVDGQVIGQSMAILEYLEETHPTPALLPKDPLGRARVRSLAQLIACDVHPVNNMRILKYLKAELGLAKPAVDEWYRHWCREGLGAFERQLEDGGSGLYCHGDQVSLADLCLAPQVFNARRFDVDVSAYPRLSAIYERLMQLEAFDRAQPARQPEAARVA